jgi:exodeoxyribonuclease VII small subunit
MSAKSKSTSQELGFGAAMEELEAILGRVESDEIDIDELAEELKRATKLLELCRQKIRKAELEVTQIVQSLEEPETATGDTEEESSDTG